MTQESKPDIKLIGRQVRRAKKLPLRSLSCRVGGDRHHWHRVHPDWEPSNAAKPMAWQCSVCTGIKRADVDPKYGFVIGRVRYEYPPWYQLHRTEGDGTDQLISSNAVRAVLADRGDLPLMGPVDSDGAE